LQIARELRADRWIPALRCHIQQEVMAGIFAASTVPCRGTPQRQSNASNSISARLIEQVTPNFWTDPKSGFLFPSIQTPSVASPH